MIQFGTDFLDGWFNHQLEQVESPLPKSYCWFFQKFDCTRYDIVDIKRNDCFFKKRMRFWNLQSWWYFFPAIWKHQLVIYLSYPFLRLELPTATLRVPVMLVLCAMSSNQATLIHSQFFPPPKRSKPFIGGSGGWIWHFEAGVWEMELLKVVDWYVLEELGRSDDFWSRVKPVLHHIKPSVEKVYAFKTKWLLLSKERHGW